MNNYIIIEDLSSGKFGKVQKVKNKFTNKLLAVKIEPVDTGLLEYEAKIYNYLSGIKNIPTIKSYKTDGKNCYLFMDLMDYSLKSFKETYFNIGDNNYIRLIKKIIIVLTITLKDIHNRNIIHRDIKPENVCFHDNSIKLIDFGISKLIDFNHNKTNNKTNNKINNIIGTPNYISLNVTQLNEPGILDELESLCYLFLYLLLDDQKFLDYTREDIVNKKYSETIKKYIKNSNYENIIVKHLEICRASDIENDKESIYNKIINLYL